MNDVTELVWAWGQVAMALVGASLAALVLAVSWPRGRSREQLQDWQPTDRTCRPGCRCGGAGL